MSSACQTDIPGHPGSTEGPSRCLGRLDSAPISGFGRIAASEQALGVKIQKIALDSNKL